VSEPARAAPLVTAIIPTFNWSSVLECSIASVLAQTFTDFELLVIGDACTDDSADVVAAFAADDERVRWINMPHHDGSQVGPNNEGLRQAQGRFVAYLGHDDLWLPRHLELLVRALRGAPDDPGLAHARVAMVNPGRPPFVFPHASWSYRTGEWIPPTSTLHRAGALRRVGGWQGREATGTLDPETDLCARVAAIFGPPLLVPRLTSIKLPAAYRRNVYRERPNAEQVAWLDRITAADDAEAEVLRCCAEVDRPGALGDDDPVALLAPLMSPSVTAVERHAALRQFKGLDPL
jgi:glycosyltransferase involved in cell wall biosynthesis